MEITQVHFPSNSCIIPYERGIVATFAQYDRHMTSVCINANRSITPIRIWMIGVSFVLFQFFLQLSSGVIIDKIMQETNISAFKAGMLSSAFYYVYTTLQVPVGILFDKYKTHILLSLAALTCSLGCVLFSHSHHILFLFYGRLLIGAGSAFAFVGLSHVLRQHFPLKQFSFMIGLSETLGFIVTVFGLIGLGALVSRWGWRGFINGAALAGVVIAAALWRYIPEIPCESEPKQPSVLQSLWKVLKTGKLWITGLFTGLSFALITVFAALWAISFIQVKLQCGLQEASILDAMLFLGAGLSCPLYGYLVNYCSKRRPLMMFSCFSTALLFLVMLYVPIQNHWVFGALMLVMGLCCGAYMLAYTIANELSPPGALSTSTGFVNTLAVITTPVLQPLVGYILDLQAHNHPETYWISDYQSALLLIPFCLVLAGILVLFLPEK